MVFWLKFSVSSANSRIRYQELFITLSFSMRVIKWGAKVKLSALESRTWYPTEDRIATCSPCGHTLSLWMRSWYLSATDRNCQKENLYVSLACWGALITPMSYPNWKELSTAVKTAKTKVPVTCGEWNTGLGNTRQFQLPTVHQSAAWVSDRFYGLVLATWHSFLYTPMFLAGLIHMGLWVSFISPILPKQQRVWDSFVQGRNQTSFSTCVCAKSLQLCPTLQPHGR